MNRPYGRARLSLLLLTLLVLHGVSARTLKDDEQSFFAFLKGVLPDYTSFYNASVSTCRWPGLTCIGLGAQQRIYRLRLGGLQLNGTIPYGSLGALSSLTVLDLSNNSLSGSIPYDIWQLQNLMELSLSGNRFTGGVSWAVGGLYQLQKLDLAGNLFSGELPSSLGTVWSLKVLDLHGNNISGQVPALVNARNLRYLDLSSNQIAGVLPTETFWCKELLVLNLSRNLLSGGIPSELNWLRKLRIVDLSQNDLVGNIPNLSNLRQLWVFNVSSNNLNGSFPSSVTRLPYVQWISVADNNLWGALPSLPWGTSPDQIKILDCSDNFLSGGIPWGLLASTNLSIVRLGRNYFSGSLPANLTDQLQELDLHGNNFTGELPATLSKLGVLKKLDLSSNKLNGSIAAGVTEISSLQYLSLAENPLQAGPLPDFTLMSNLVHLNLSFCNVNSSIPATLSLAINLMTLDLSYNDLTGEIPLVLTDLTKLTDLDLSYNNLSGLIPSGNQWSRFNRSSFAGNPLLCGILVDRVCPLVLPPSPAVAPSPIPVPPPVLPSTPVVPPSPVVLPSPVVSPPPDGISAPPASSPAIEPAAHSGSGLKAIAIVAIVIGIVLGLAAALVLFLLFRRRKYRNLPTKEPVIALSGPVSFDMDPGGWAAQVLQPASIPVIMFEKPLLNLTFADLLHATNKFHRDSQMPDTGYGLSFQGMLPGGFRIVVKVLYDGGTGNELEKAAQLEALGKIRHENLVSLVGYCLVGGERLLVYEYMENGNVYRRLHGASGELHHPDHWTQETWEDAHERFLGHEELSWPVRHRIAVGVARALAFLHHGCSPNVIHRDITSRNILLDVQYEPHLASCGLAALVEPGKLPSPVLGGALGYVPPEYGQTWNATPRGDVYSFGVVLLELVTGKRPTGHYHHDNYGGNLVGWVRALIREKLGYKCLDPMLLSSGVESEMLESLRIGYLCTAEVPTKRPTMQQVVGLLKDIHVEVTYM